MRIVKDVLKRNRAAIALWVLFFAVDLAVFLLYNVFIEPFFYAAALTLFFLLVFLAADFVRERKRAAERTRAKAAVTEEWRVLPEARSASEEDYQEMLRMLGQRIETLTAEFDAEKQDSVDYYTSWVHQIKTPIAVMRLKLSEDTAENRALLAELFRIEQYADMVLQYVRLGSSTNDLVIREYDLDEMLRESVRKFAPQFVGKNIRLDYEPVGKRVVTDRKWFGCIIDQLISNALKYTQAGSIAIRLEKDRLLISDTGIGIAAEDLPRIFEKGYTGENGRIGEKSSGLGLYLAKRAADLLAIPLSAESAVGEGSVFALDLSGKGAQ